MVAYIYNIIQYVIAVNKISILCTSTFNVYIYIVGIYSHHACRLRIMNAYNWIGTNDDESENNQVAIIAAGTTVTVLTIVTGLVATIIFIVVLKVHQSKAKETSQGECITIDYMHVMQLVFAIHCIIYPYWISVEHTVMGDDNDSPQTVHVSSVHVLFDLKDKPKELFNVLILLKVSLWKWIL